MVGECLSQFAPNYGPMENVSPKGIGIAHGSMGVDTYRERERCICIEMYINWCHFTPFSGVGDMTSFGTGYWFMNSTDSIWSVNPWQKKSSVTQNQLAGGRTSN